MLDSPFLIICYIFKLFEKSLSFSRILFGLGYLRFFYSVLIFLTTLIFRRGNIANHHITYVIFDRPLIFEYISSYFYTAPCLESFKFPFNRITHDCLSHYSCNYPFPVNHYYNTLGHLSYTIYQMGWVTLSHSHKNIFPRPSLSNLFKHFVLCIMKL